MEKVKLTIDIVKANIFAIVLFVAIAVVFIPLFVVVWGCSIDYKSFWLIIALLVGIPIHELIHGITWAIFTPSKWKSISFGVIWKLLTPYCHCNEPLKVNQYIWGALMPLIVLGIIPLIIAFIIGNFEVLLFSLLFIIAASGDIMCSWILRHENSDSLVEDHPSEAGCWVYRNNKVEQK